MNFADELYMTRVERTGEGDVYFPSGWEKHFPIQVFHRKAQEVPNEELKYSIEVWSKE